MDKFLPLDTEQKTRLGRALRRQAPLSSLETPEELHYAARNWDRENDPVGLGMIFARSDCSLATALLIYWNAEPVRLFFRCTDRSEAERELDAGDLFDLLLAIEGRVSGGGFPPLSIGYDPANDNGTDLTEGWNTPGMKRAIPEFMLRAAEGLRADPLMFL